jgi:hypothetical protein
MIDGPMSRRTLVALDVAAKLALFASLLPGLGAGRADRS